MLSYTLVIDITVKETGEIRGELLIPEDVLQAQEGTPLAHLRDRLLKLCSDQDVLDIPDNPVLSVESYLQSIKKLNEELNAAIGDLSTWIEEWRK